jgi:phosphoglucomutase
MMTQTFHKLRHTQSGLSYIQSFGEYGVTRIKDISLGYDSKIDTRIPVDKSISPSSEMITFELDDSTVMTLRGSGTEPKLKYYIEAKGSSLNEAELKAERVENALKMVFRNFRLEG